MNFNCKNGSTDEVPQEPRRTFCCTFWKRRGEKKMSPAAKAPAPKHHSRFREILERFNPNRRFEQGTHEIMKGAESLAREQRDKSTEVAVQGRPETRSEAELLAELRIKRLERFVSQLPKEQQEAVVEFMDHLMQNLAQARQKGAADNVLEHFASERLEAFCEDVWGRDSPLNKRRIVMMMRFLRENEVLPKEHVVYR
jgi:hypothetical protein